jgi:hypothetical protein
MTLTNTPGAGSLSWGPWRVPEPFGSIVNVIGCGYMLTVALLQLLAFDHATGRNIYELQLCDGGRCGYFGHGILLPRRPQSI